MENYDDDDEKTVKDDENYLPSFCNSLSYKTLRMEEQFCYYQFKL